MSIACPIFHSPPAGDAEIETVGDLRQSVAFEWPVVEVLRSSKIAVLEWLLRAGAAVRIDSPNVAAQPEADLAASAAALPAIAVIDTAKSTDHLMTFLGRSSLRA